MDEVRAAGGQMVLSNAYHLYLRPGTSWSARWAGCTRSRAGRPDADGLRRLPGVLARRSCARSRGRRRVPEPSRRVAAPVHARDRHAHRAQPRRRRHDAARRADRRAGAEHEASRAAMERSLRWLERCRVEFERIGREGREVPPDFPMPPGAPRSRRTIPRPTCPRRRRRSSRSCRAACTPTCVARRRRHPLQRRLARRRGRRVVGRRVEGRHVRDARGVRPELPRDKPRYLMGVGFPDDLIEGMRRGIDLFDCVVPTRMGRHGTAFTPDGTVQIRRAAHRTDRRPLVRVARARAARATTAPICATCSWRGDAGAAAARRCTT